MRLTNLSPRWFQPEHWSVPIRAGVTFLCPHCRAVYLGVWFRNPIEIDTSHGTLADFSVDWDQVLAAHNSLGWNRTGDTFETLTLAPSIDTSKHGHWHGFITNGEIIG